MDGSGIPVVVVVLGQWREAVGDRKRAFEATWGEVGRRLAPGVVTLVARVQTLAVHGRLDMRVELPFIELLCWGQGLGAPHPRPGRTVGETTVQLSLASKESGAILLLLVQTPCLVFVHIVLVGHGIKEMPLGLTTHGVRRADTRIEGMGLDTRGKKRRSSRGRRDCRSGDWGRRERRRLFVINF